MLASFAFLAFTSQITLGDTEYNSPTPHTQLRKQVNHVVVSLQWRGPCNIHGVVLDGQSHQPGCATAQTLMGCDVIRVTPIVRTYSK